MLTRRQFLQTSITAGGLSALFPALASASPLSAPNIVPQEVVELPERKHLLGLYAQLASDDSFDLRPTLLNTDFFYTRNNVVIGVATSCEHNVLSAGDGTYHLVDYEVTGDTGSLGASLLYAADYRTSASKLRFSLVHRNVPDIFVKLLTGDWVHPGPNQTYTVVSKLEAELHDEGGKFVFASSLTLDTPRLPLVQKEPVLSFSAHGDTQKFRRATPDSPVVYLLDFAHTRGELNLIESATAAVKYASCPFADQFHRVGKSFFKKA